MIAVFLICLGILYSLCQVYYKLFHNSFHSTGITTSPWSSLPLVSSSSKCAKCTVGIFRMGWLPLSFLRGKKLVALGLGGVSVAWSLGATPWILPSWLLRWPLCSLNKSLPVDPPLGRLPSLSVTWGACHKKQSLFTSATWSGESGQERKKPEPGVVLKGALPSLIQFLCLPSVIGITPGSVHPMLSHYYSVRPRLWTHHSRLYLYQSSTLTCQGSLAKIKLHRAGGYNLYTLHTGTLSDPTSNSW